MRQILTYDRSSHSLGATHMDRVIAFLFFAEVSVCRAVVRCVVLQVLNLAHVINEEL